MGVGGSTPWGGKSQKKYFFQISNFFDRFGLYTVCTYQKSAHMPSLVVLRVFNIVLKCMCLLKMCLLKMFETSLDIFKIIFNGLWGLFW